VTSRVAQLSVSFLQIHEFAASPSLAFLARPIASKLRRAAGGTWTVSTIWSCPKRAYIWNDYDSPNVPGTNYRAAELP